MLALRLAEKPSSLPSAIRKLVFWPVNRASAAFPSCANAFQFMPIEWNAVLPMQLRSRMNQTSIWCSPTFHAAAPEPSAAIPEIRHRLRPEELLRHAERQRAILLAALRAVRPGGRIVYSTCSLEPEENEQVVAAVLAENQNARQLSLESRIRALTEAGILTASGAAQLRDCLTPEGALRLLPGALPTDSFFVALIEKNP